MTKITRESVKALFQRRNYKNGNTEVVVNGKDTNLFLYDKLIAVNGGDSLMITTAGRPTRTTKERLNGIPGVKVTTKSGQLLLNGVMWDGEVITI